MGLSDPFQSTYEGSRQAFGAYGQAFQDIAKSYQEKKLRQQQIARQEMMHKRDIAEQQGVRQEGYQRQDAIRDEGRTFQETQKQKNIQQSTEMLKRFGVLKQDTIEPDVTDYEKALSENSSKIGLNNLQIQGSSDPEKRKNEIKNLLDPLGLSPKPKLTEPTLDVKKASELGVNFDSEGNLKVSPPKQDELATELKRQRLGAIDTNRQDKLEKQAGDYMNKIISYRSGGLGLQDSKVNQAIDLRNLIDQNKDSKTGEYKISPAFQTELVLGLARLISPTGQVGVELEKELSQKTAKEGLANMLIYFGGDPKQVGGSTQSVIQAYVDAIDRQGNVSEELRDKYTEGIKQRAEFSGLNQESKNRILHSTLGSSFKEYLNKGKLQGQQSTQGQTQSFNSEQDVINANLPNGTKIMINGREAVWE